MKNSQNDLESRVYQICGMYSELMAFYKDVYILIYCTLQLTQSAVLAPMGGRFSSISQLITISVLSPLSVFRVFLASVLPCTAAVAAVRVGGW